MENGVNNSIKTNFRILDFYVSQSGENQPVIESVVENTLGFTPSIQYNAPGSYGFFHASLDAVNAYKIELEIHPVITGAINATNIVNMYFQRLNLVGFNNLGLFTTKNGILTDGLLGVGGTTKVCTRLVIKIHL